MSVIMINHLLKPKLREFVGKVSDKVVTLRRGENEVLSLDTPISGLYNTENDALGVVVGKHNMHVIENSFL